MAAQTQRRKAPTPTTKAKAPKTMPERPANLPVLLYTAAEAAVILHASVYTVRQMTRLGTLGSLKVGRFRCIPAWTLEAFIRAQMGETAGEAGIGA